MERPFLEVCEGLVIFPRMGRASWGQLQGAVPGPSPSPWSDAMSRAAGPDALGPLSQGEGETIPRNVQSIGCAPSQSSRIALCFEWAKDLLPPGKAQGRARHSDTFILAPLLRVLGPQGRQGTIPPTPP